MNTSIIKTNTMKYASTNFYRLMACFAISCSLIACKSSTMARSSKVTLPSNLLSASPLITIIESEKDLKRSEVKFELKVVPPSESGLLMDSLVLKVEVLGNELTKMAPYFEIAVWKKRKTKVGTFALKEYPDKKHQSTSYWCTLDSSHLYGSSTAVIVTFVSDNHPNVFSRRYILKISPILEEIYPTAKNSTGHENGGNE